MYIYLLYIHCRMDNGSRSSRKPRPQSSAIPLLVLHTYICEEPIEVSSETPDAEVPDLSFES